MSEPQALYVLLAPTGQLTAHGQLRETIRERRKRIGDNVAFWYLSPELVQQFNLCGAGFEAVVAKELTAINWLKMRFGGESRTAQLDVEELHEHANSLPPSPISKNISS